MLNELRAELTRRGDLSTIARIIPDGTRILDLGCGAGNFLKLMKLEKNADVTGVEIDQAKIIDCAAKGVPVIQADLDDGLKEFSDQSFDYVILSRTLQATRRPDLLLAEMLRVGRHGIVSIMNVGHLHARFQMLMGRMPITPTLPDPWYSTDNIHLSTIEDFKDLCKVMSIRIERQLPVTQPDESFAWLAKAMPNTFAQNCVFIIRR